MEAKEFQTEVLAALLKMSETLNAITSSLDLFGDRYLKTLVREEANKIASRKGKRGRPKGSKNKPKIKGRK